jgi:type II secretory ATPase GspE/PulE/Tfp pilus assembly ATPase PilB-like protein
MYRLLLIVLVALVALTAPLPAFAGDADWPIHDEVDVPNAHDFVRGRGGYLSITKIVFLWLSFLGWVATTTWVHQDVHRVRMPYVIWTPVVFFPFLVCFFLFGLLLPVFVLGYLLVLIGLGAPLGVYIWKRNQHVQPHQRVLTPDHLRHVFSERASTFGMKVDAEKKANYQKGAPVDLTARGGENEQKNQANIIRARQLPGFMVAKELFADALDNRADKVMLDYTKEAVAVRYQIDGVWHEAPAKDRASGDNMLSALKMIANLDPADRRNRQAGEFGAEYAETKYDGSIVTQGTQTGERVILQLEEPGKSLDSLDALGMREAMQMQLRELMGKKQGFLLFSSPPACGLSTTLRIALGSTDRLMREVVSIEDEAKREEEVDNITPTTYKAAAGETPADLLPKVLRNEPEFIIVPRLHNAQTVKMLSSEAVDGRLVLATIPAKEAVEALVRVLLLKAPAAEFANAATAVLSMRLIRKLCDECKEPYAPSPDMLKKLGLPADRVKAFYRPGTPKPIKKGGDPVPCAKCNGLGYFGRTGLYELLVVDDQLRKALVSQPKLDVLRKVARAAKHRSLQDEGVILAVKGITSLQEVTRVLKQ